jgi:hypothetical protein
MQASDYSSHDPASEAGSLAMLLRSASAASLSALVDGVASCVRSSSELSATTMGKHEQGLASTAWLLQVGPQSCSACWQHLYMPRSNVAANI